MTVRVSDVCRLAQLQPLALLFPAARSRQLTDEGYGMGRNLNQCMYAWLYMSLVSSLSSVLSILVWVRV